MRKKFRKCNEGLHTADSWYLIYKCIKTKKEQKIIRYLICVTFIIFDFFFVNILIICLLINYWKISRSFFLRKTFCKKNASFKKKIILRYFLVKDCGGCEGCERQMTDGTSSALWCVEEYHSCRVRMIVLSWEIHSDPVGKHMTDSEVYWFWKRNRLCTFLTIYLSYGGLLCSGFFNESENWKHFVATVCEIC